MSKLLAGSFSAKKGHLQSTERVVWNTLDSLGRGATAVVYLGRIKTTGRTVAVKVFHDSIPLQARELDLLQRLKHENIISLLSIERESFSNHIVLIMEYCEGGSLYHVLEQPKHAFGLQEADFILVLKHIAAGMGYLRAHGVIHRDIKPGNIMRFITEDGKYIYKLTDFGAARELPENEQFTSLYGTEEYLHPRMYERAVLRQPTSQRFTAVVDLWSLGVTIYHTATGQLPFQPYGGRHNKDKMFEITTQKGRGVISGLQKTQNGDIIWSKHLPPTCPLSSGVRQDVEPLIAGLVETDVTEAISYDTFFHIVNNIASKITISIFNVSSAITFTICVNGTDNYSSIQEHIAAMTEIPAYRQLILYDGSRLEDIIDPTSALSTYPIHNLNTDLFLFQPDTNIQEIDRLILPENPSSPDFDMCSDMERDYRLAYTCSSRASLIKHHVANVVHRQELLIQAERCLRKYVLSLLKKSEHKFESMSTLATYFKKRLHTFHSMLTMNQTLLTILKHPVKLFNDAVSDQTVIAVYEKAEERIKEIGTYRTALVERLQNDQDKVKKEQAPCAETDCLSTMEHHLSALTAVQNRFRRDKSVRNEMTQHDREIHVFEKQKMQGHYVAMCSLPQDHCYRNLDIMHTEYHGYISSLLKNLNRVSKVEKNVDSVIGCFDLLSSKLDKVAFPYGRGFTGCQHGGREYSSHKEIRSQWQRHVEIEIRLPIAKSTLDLNYKSP